MSKPPRKHGQGTTALLRKALQEKPEITLDEALRLAVNENDLQTVLWRMRCSGEIEIVKVIRRVDTIE